MAFMGKNVFAHAKSEVLAQQEKMTQPFRFSVDKGASKDIIILDHTINDLYAHYEHFIKPVGEGFQGSITVVSPKTDGKFDPLEGAVINGHQIKSPGFRTLFSVLDLTPYTASDGTVRTHSRKVMSVTPTVLDALSAVLHGIQDQHKKIRGLKITMVRSVQNNSPGTGMPTPPGGVSYTVLSEAELIKLYGHEAIMKKEAPTEVKYPKNEFLKPFDYASVYPVPTELQLRQRFGLDIPVGSEADLEQDDVVSDFASVDDALEELGHTPEVELDDDIPF